MAVRNASEQTARIAGARTPQHAGSVADSDRPPEPRLPEPLPHAVSVVARANLMLFGALAVAGTLFLAVSGVAVVAFPLVLGREGVGRAMITLFLFCSTAVATGVAVLGARSAARVIRRERRGVGSLLAFVRFGAVVAVVASGLVWWLSVAFFGEVDDPSLMSRWGKLIAVGVSAIAFVFFVYGMTVLRGFRKSMTT